MLQQPAMPTWLQPPAVSQLSAVHALPSSQSGGGPPLHDPPLQVSLVVQALPSVHGALLLAYAQPVAGLQASSVQGLPSVQAALKSV